MLVVFKSLWKKKEKFAFINFNYSERPLRFKTFFLEHEYNRFNYEKKKSPFDKVHFCLKF